MENANLPKTTHIVNLLEELSEKEAQRATLVAGRAALAAAEIPGPAIGQLEAAAQELLFEIAEIGAEIVQIVRDLESASAECDEDAAPSKPRWGDVSGQVRFTTTL